MSVSPEARRVVMGAIAHVRHTDRSIVQRAEFDTTRWLRRLQAYLHEEEPFVEQEVATGSSEDYLQQRINEYIRSGRDAEVENLRALDGLRKSVKQQQRIVQIRNDDGDYIAKELQFCSPRELDALASQYEASARADMRRGRFYRDLAQQARLLGLGETAQLARLLA